jgi:glycosyltransferase involved in cell wall biosynthesis
MTKLLLLGPRTNHKNPEMTSGTIVLFESMIHQCEKNNINFHVIDTNKKNYSNFLAAHISIFAQLLYYQRKCNHISLHSSRDFLIYGLIIIIIGKIFGKKTSLRKFAGDAANLYQSAHGMKKQLLHFIFSHINFLFLELKQLVDFFHEINPNTYWFPNVRKRELEPQLPRRFNKRFVFMSHVTHEKGIDEILEASNRVSDNYTIDIYGNIKDSKYTKDYFTQFHANYKRALSSEEVLVNLNQYDVLLLPSYKEGYPGIIIEAYSLGIPVIATSLTGIKEITENYQTGILIPLQNVDELVSAMEYFNESNYPQMSAAAYRKFQDFDAGVQTRNFLKTIGAL